MNYISSCLLKIPDGEINKCFLFSSLDFPTGFSFFSFCNEQTQLLKSEENQGSDPFLRYTCAGFRGAAHLSPPVARPHQLRERGGMEMPAAQAHSAWGWAGDGISISPEPQPFL